jgi:hypothetical protein
MSRITSIQTPAGYKFALNEVELAEGEWSSGMFLLIDNDSMTEHINGMAALDYLNRKYNPAYFTRPLRHAPQPNQSSDLSRFKKHPALADVTMEVMFAK